MSYEFLKIYLEDNINVMIGFVKSLIPVSVEIMTDKRKTNLC